MGYPMFLSLSCRDKALPATKQNRRKKKKMKAKKFTALLLALVMLLALCACGSGSGTEQSSEPSTQPTQQGSSSGSDNEQTGGDSEQQGDTGSELAGTYDVTVWVPEAAVELTKTQIGNFNSSNEYGITINATVEPVSEADAANNMITDVAAGGDIFFFAQDQLSRMIQAGAVGKLGQGAAQTVSANNDAGTVMAATAGGDIYAYPLTSDNGYFMYYDKSVITDESHLSSMEALIADCEAAGKLFSFQLDDNAWYLASFFFGAGCHNEWTYAEDGTTIEKIDDDFNSPNGIIACKGLKKLLSSPAYNNSSDVSAFANGSAIVVSGTWGYKDALDILGDNLGAAELPSFEVDGQTYHLGSYSGCKLLGVKPQEDAKTGAALNQLALYLTGKDCQMERFQETTWGPSNLEAQADPSVSTPALVAYAAQSAYAVPQPVIPGGWWEFTQVIAIDVKNAADETGYQAALDKYQQSLDALMG